MSRTKLADRELPAYSRGEEIFNMVTHIVGGGFGILVLVLSVVFSVIYKNWWGLAGGIVYGIMMIFLYTMSSIYHGLIPERPKKVFQVLDHTTIFALILGTYMPILLTGIREYNPKLAYIMLAVLYVGTAVGVTFTAIDFHKYRFIVMPAYFVIGWSALFAIVPIYKALGLEFLIWLIAGGAAYTLGMIFFRIGMRKAYYHSIFHLFVLAGSVLHFIGIFKFCICR